MQILSNDSDVYIDANPVLDASTVSITFRTLGGAFPSALIWASLLAGPVDGRLRPWFCAVLRLACSNAYPPVTDFKTTLENYIKPQWLWCDRLTASAERFWEEAFAGVASGEG